MRRSLKKLLLKHVEAGDLAKLKELIADGADVSFRSRYGQTPLVVAMHRHQVEVAHLLLDAGADPNTATESGATPLFWAARYGYVDLVCRLLELGANVYAKRDGVASALSTAVYNNHHEVAEVLIAHGADVNEPIGQWNLMGSAKDARMKEILKGRKVR